MGREPGNMTLISRSLGMRLLTKWDGNLEIRSLNKGAISWPAARVPFTMRSILCSNYRYKLTNLAHRNFGPAARVPFTMRSILCSNYRYKLTNLAHRNFV